MQRGLGGRKIQNLSGFRRACGVAAEFAAHVAQACNQLGVAFGEPLAIELDVVLKARAQMAAQLQRPAIDLELMAANSRRRPGRVGHDFLDFRDQEFEHAPAVH